MGSSLATDVDVHCCRLNYNGEEGVSVQSKRYFSSTYNWKIRNTAIQLDNFNDVKAVAYKAASEGISNGFSTEWANKYVNNIPPSSRLWWYEEMIRAYADYLNGVKTKEESSRIISDIEGKWNELDELVGAVFKFRKAANEAFKKQGIEFGVVEFTCPICGGQAKASRHNTPNNPAHAVTVREGCSSCGYSSMN
jgi:hypothetical protein